MRLDGITTSSNNWDWFFNFISNFFRKSRLLRNQRRTPIQFPEVANYQMKLIVAGGRSYRLGKDDIEKLNSFSKVAELVTGGATGVDSDAEAWAMSRNISITKFMPDWEHFGRAAGPIRNKKMAEYADAVILFPGGKGTASMLKEAQIAELTIYDYRGR